MPDPMPARVRLKLYRGDTRVWEDRFLIDEQPVDLTGYTFSSQIRADVNSPDVLATIEVDPFDPTGGKIRRTLTAEESAKLTGQRAYWDLQLIRESDGFVRTYMAGPVKIVGDGTHE